MSNTFAFLYNLLSNHMTPAVLVMIGPEKLMVGTIARAQALVGPGLAMPMYKSV